MVYTGYIDYKINFPCDFQGDSLNNLELEFGEYIDNAINNNPVSVDYGNASVTSAGCTVDIFNFVVSVTFSLDCDAYDDEDVFVGENSEIIQEFVNDVEDTLNRLLADHDIFGYLPEGEDVIYDNDSLYVRLAYHQDDIHTYNAPTIAGFDGDIDDVLSDTFLSA